MPSVGSASPTTRRGCGLIASPPRGAASRPLPLVLHGQPGVAHEWRLVAITGRVDNVHKLGDRWRAEVVVGNQKVVVVGEAGAGIASSALVAGRSATVVGIARRPFPSATDRRFAVTPRFPADVRVDGKTAAAAAGGTGSTQAGGTGAAGGGTDGPDGHGATGGPSAPAAAAADLVDLDGLIGATVRVGGLVVDLRADGFTLDDGTATGRVILRGPALDVLPLIEPDDALEATGHVERSTDGAAVVVVDDPAAIVQASDPTGAAASPSASAGPLAAGIAGSPPPAAGQPVRRSREWSVPVGSRRGGTGDAPGDLGRFAGHHGPPQAAVAASDGGPDRDSTGHVRGVVDGLSGRPAGAAPR